MSFFSLFQIPPSFKKLILTEQKEKTTVCIIQITSRCTHFGFHQDKIKHLLNYWWNMNKVLPIIRQENNTGKDFFFPSFLLDQDNIYRDAKLPHLSKNSTSEYENNRTKKVIVRARTGFVMEAPEVSQVPVSDRCGLYIVLFFKKKFIHSNTSPYTANQPQICISVFDTQF